MPRPLVRLVVLATLAVALGACGTVSHTVRPSIQPPDSHTASAEGAEDAPALVLAARDIGGVVLLQATFTFIGIGGDSIWGGMLSQGRDWVIGPGGSVLRYWWVFLPPTIAVMLFGIAWNMLGDGLNDALDPQMA